MTSIEINELINLQGLRRNLHGLHCLSGFYPKITKFAMHIKNGETVLILDAV